MCIRARYLLPLLLALAQPLYAADTGQFLFTNAAPNPVAAGGSVFLRGAVVNQGSEVWTAASTYLIAEIYDKDKKYIISSDRQRLTADVAPGGNIQVDLSIPIPIDYTGSYSFRVFVVHNEQRIIQSDYSDFTVTPRALPPGGALAPPQPGRPPVTVGGNVTVSYTNPTGTDGWQLDENVNLNGRMGDRPYDFNANGITNRANALDTRTVLFNYHGAWADIGLGDVSPNFSALSVSGQGARGALIKTRPIDLGPVKWVIEAVGARVAASQEGTATSNGVFERILYGTQSSFLLPGGVTVRGNYADVEDVRSSLSTPGPSLTSVTNQTEGGGVSWVASKDLKFDGDFQHSSFKAAPSSAALSDDAWKVGFGWTRPRWALTGAVARTGTNFTDLAAPGVAKDRMSYDGSLMLRPLDWFTLNNTYNQFQDNLNSDPAKTQTTQKSVNSGATVSLPTRTRLLGGYSYSQSVGNPRSTVNNRTEGPNAGIHQAWETGSVDLSYKRSMFTDVTGTSNNLLTNTYNWSWNWILSKALTTTLGEVLSDTHNEGNGSTLRTTTYSGSFNTTLDPTLSLRGSVSFTDTTNNAAAAPAQTQNKNINLELTWKASKALAFTGGINSTVNEDALNPANNRTANGVVARVTYSF